MKLLIAICLLAAVVSSAKIEERKEKVSFLKFCPPVPVAEEKPQGETVESKCKTFYALGVEIVDARKESGNDAKIIIDKVKCITQQFTNDVASIPSVCLKKGMVDRAVHYQTEETLAARNPAFANKRGSLGL